jgi:hypothetical protein
VRSPVAPIRPLLVLAHARDGLALVGVGAAQTVGGVPTVGNTKPPVVPLVCTEPRNCCFPCDHILERSTALDLAVGLIGTSFSLGRVHRLIATVGEPVEKERATLEDRH